MASSRSKTRKSRAHTLSSLSQDSSSLAVFGLGVSVSMINPFSAGAQEFHHYDLPLVSRVIATADFNQDGVLDVVASGGTQFCILLNNGDGTLADAVAYTANAGGKALAIADFNLDRYPDVVVMGGSEFAIHLNDQTGQFVPGAIVSAENVTRDIAVGDINGDDLPDIILVGDEGKWGKGQMWWYRNLGDGTWELGDRVKTYLRDWGRLLGVVAGDVDHDGDLDICTTGEGADGAYINDRDFKTFRNQDGLGTAWDEQTVKTRYGGDFDGPIHGPQIGDLDNDGDLDLVCVVVSQEYDAFIETSLNNGSGKFGLARAIAKIDARGDSTTPKVAFINGENDRDLDLMFLGRGSESNLWFLRNNGDNRFTPYPVGGAYGTDIIAADITGDGAVDWLTNSSHILTVIENTWPQEGPHFEVSPIVRGRQTSFSLTNATPDRWAFFVWSPHEPGYSKGLQPIGGMTLNLQGPFRQFGSKKVDANGEAVFSSNIPANLALHTLTMQVVTKDEKQVWQKSNFVFAPVLD